MKLSAATLPALLVAAALPAAASAQATLSVDPVKDCYSTGETVDLLGTGFTPLGSVDVFEDDEELGQLSADSGGDVTTPLTLGGVDSGAEDVTFTATDATNPALTAYTTLRVSAPDVQIRPTKGPAGRRLRINATGFASGSTLYAHVRHVATGRVRTVRIGALSGRCGRLHARKRILRASAAPGRYVVQFDTLRRYARLADVRVRFSVAVAAPAPPPKPKPRPVPPTDCQGYSPCLQPGADVDCAGGSGNGPRYVEGPVYVTGSDPYGLDSDGDGVACES